ncbi:TonB-dependent receptor domain-containing protein [Phenylobacterium sp.]|jgi:iron complex outermembrane receptor protein|uniref:TonB-dependent receptor domain-containing protein n=1 Tax=Phenylobacterium sp. TaxID=1871053 RepID=UPI002E3032AD|nr:TonB-dependent receptor [Phenylobacterium sp.]HEX2559307.1 TonB-dependent receptor [Phenylobacterium sp.]
MNSRSYLCGGSLLAVAIALGVAGPAAAQNEVEEVVVTGSFIAGTPEDAALPVDVTTSEDLQKQGSPTVVQLVKSLPAAASSIGESNRFLGNAAGSASVNLRGFGSNRTLVLMNGRRLAPSPGTVALAGVYDINLIPVAAIGRIEVLKGGAAATYGSEAIGGVVNFITRRDLEGFEVNANYNYIDGSEGDWDASIAYGFRGDRLQGLFTAGYRRRSELRTTDRDWALQPNVVNPLGGWSAASNPGGYQFFPVGGATGAVPLPGGAFGQPPASPANPGRAITLTSFNDPGCLELGGTRNATGQCLFQYSRFDNLVNDEDHWQFFGELNYDLTENITWHAEAFWSMHEVAAERVSPSQSTIVFPSPIAASGGSPGGGTSPFPALAANESSRFYIPFANPGLQALFNSGCAGVVGQTPAAVCAGIQNGVVANQTAWRPRGYGGNPLFEDGADHQRRAVEAYRVSTGFKGEIFEGLGFDAAVTYMEAIGEFDTPDIVTNRLQLALRGLGGPGCNPTTGTPGAGACQWFNPFANGIQQDAVYGNQNPFFNPAAVPANTNTRELYDWMHEYVRSEGRSKNLIADLIFNGEGLFTLPGGEIAWAAGLQFRREELETIAVDPRFNIEQNPCVDDIDDRTPQCTIATGVTNFVGNIDPSASSRDVKAVFAEVKLPILENLDLTLAARYEDFGGTIGSTTNPKADLRWEVIDGLALRGSIGSTFRAPPQSSITPGFARINSAFTDPTTLATLYRPADTYGNPDLEPETADYWSLGVIVDKGPFSATIDYWNFNFHDELATETAARIFQAMFPSATASSWQCGNAALRARFNFATGTTFTGPDGSNCHPSNLLAVRSNNINGPGVDTSGVDFQANVELPDLGDIQWNIGVEGSYLIEYKRGALRTLEGDIIEPELDRAGKLELISAFYSYPRIKANAYANFNWGEQNLRATLRYVSEMEDRNHDINPALAGVQAARVGEYIQVDLAYRVALPWDTMLTLKVDNLFDEEPEFVRSQYNYDYTLANPLGRVFGIGVRKHF